MTVMSDGDFDPDAHPPIRRDRCLATAWFDDDCMPAVCRRDWGHDGGHKAALQQCHMPTPEWVDEAHGEATGALAGVEVDQSHTDGIRGPQIGSERTGDAA